MPHPVDDMYTEEHCHFWEIHDVRLHYLLCQKQPKHNITCTDDCRLCAHIMRNKMPLCSLRDRASSAGFLLILPITCKLAYCKIGPGRRCTLWVLLFYLCIVVTSLNRRVMIGRSITTYVETRSVLTYSKNARMVFGLGSAPDPARGAFGAP